MSGRQGRFISATLLLLWQHPQSPCHVQVGVPGRLCLLLELSVCALAGGKWVRKGTDESRVGQV